MRIASVAVSNMKALGDRLFDYCVPEKLQNTVRPGAFVLIGFGKADKRTKGIVFSLRDGEPERKLKPIYAVLDNSALLSDEAMVSMFTPSLSSRPERSVTCMAVPIAPISVDFAT